MDEKKEKRKEYLRKRKRKTYKTDPVARARMIEEAKKRHLGKYPIDKIKSLRGHIKIVDDLIADIFE